MASNKVWYVVIERDYDSGESKETKFLFFGPFTKKQADWALNDDVEIDTECQENCIDAWKVKYREIDFAWLDDAAVVNPMPNWRIGWEYNDAGEAPYKADRRVKEIFDLLPKE